MLTCHETDVVSDKWRTFYQQLRKKYLTKLMHWILAFWYTLTVQLNMYVYCFITGRNAILKHINETHPSYDLIQYQLLFSFGSGHSFETNWQIHRITINVVLQIMGTEDNYILLYRDLLNIFIVDMCTIIKSEWAPTQ